MRCYTETEHKQVINRYVPRVANNQQNNITEKKKHKTYRKTQYLEI